MVGVVLVVFSLFHHVLPNIEEPIERIVEIEISPTVQPVKTAALPEVQATATPVPTYAPGDFTASFPMEDTGVGAAYSYQSDSLRIAVNKVQENGITYFAADVWIKDISLFQTAFAGGQYGKGQRDVPLDMAEENNAILAVTGDYYGARSSGVVIRNGELYREKTYEDVCVLYFDGTMETFTEHEFDLDSAIVKKAWQAWSFGPELLKDGLAIEEFGSSISGKNPRCGIGYYEPGHYCLVVVDGRQTGYSSGMTLAEFSSLFYSMGCKAAYNLDGGATAQMVFQGELTSRPTGGGRKSSDIIFFGVG
jgi:exopolysaccharide biosynthesis protein